MEDFKINDDFDVNIDFQDVPPISRCAVCWNVPLDNSYTDTLTFKNEWDQLQYFESKVKFNYNELSPIRMGQPIRLPVPADALFDCNYLILQNGNTSVKHLFAFITQIEYINMNTCYVHYELDVMQTWFFNMDIKICFVEREHVNSDNVGEHTIDEGIDIGEYIDSQMQRSGVTSKKAVLVSEIASSESLNGELTAGIYSGLRQLKFDVEDNNAAPIADVLLRKINEGKEDEIISIQMIPADFYTKSGDKKGKWVKFEVNKDNQSLDGYTPRNNKLKTYPYVYLAVNNTQGQENSYRYEWFYKTNGKCSFEIEGATTGDNVELVLSPTFYNGNVNSIDNMTLAEFPMCAWSGDAFKAYLAQNSSADLISMGTNLASMALSGATGNYGAAVGAAGNIVAMGQRLSYQSQSGKTQHGSRGSNTMYSMDKMDFYFYKRSIKSDYAKMIDDYFTRYGYKVNRLKRPNITGRNSFNYVKTTEATITGTIPFGDISKIKTIFNKGITFWHGDWVGEYDRDNRII